MNASYRAYLRGLERTNAMIVVEPPTDRSFAALQDRALGRMGHLLDFLTWTGDLPTRMPLVHVGGTSGKGSTSAMIAAGLSAAGYRTALHVSPYLQVATEKLQLDGRLASGEEFEALVDEVLGDMERWVAAGGEPFAYGECWIALTLRYFRQQRAEAGVIEVGVGGRFDLSNIIQPALSVITSVGFDHTETLGSTLAEIAWHKAGIIKSGASAVTAVRDPEALTVIRAEAAEQQVRLVEVDPGPAAGGFHGWNAATSGAALRELRSIGLEIDEAAIATGIARARLPGRAELVQDAPPVLLDGAHNPQKMAALSADLDRILRRTPGGRRIGVIGVLGYKDSAAVIAAIAHEIDLLVVTRPQVVGKPGADPARVAAEARAAGFTGELVLEEEPATAIERALALAGPDDAVIVTGSLYLVGNIRSRWYPNPAVVEARTSWPA